MFERLKRALDAALSSLERESDDQVREDLDRLLDDMRSELVQVRARIKELEAQPARIEREIGAEEKRIADCERRARQAVRSGDDETAQIALRFEVRHRERADVLRRKLEATRAELAQQRREAADMTAQLKSARARREALGIQARRARSTERLRGGGRSAVDDFERVRERVERESDRAAAERELDEELAGTGPGRSGPGYGASAAGRAPDAGELEDLDAEALAEARLRELKRRMADEGGARS